MRPSKHGSGPSPSGSDQRWLKDRELGDRTYSDAECELLKARDDYRRRHGRKFLDVTEIMLELGYRRV